MADSLRAHVPTEAYADLLRAGRPREFLPGETLFHQGDPCDSLFLLRHGRVAVRVQTPDGDEVCVGLLVAPDSFGEVGLLHDDPHHTATVVALDDVLVLSILSSRFHELRMQHPSLTEWLLHTLAHRLERSSGLLADALFLDADHRVARRLLDCTRSFGADPGVSLPLVQDDIAVMAGVSRSTANRSLRRLEDAGIVVLRRRHIDVVDLGALEQLAR